MKFLQKQLQRLAHAFRGLHHAVRTDFSFETQVFGGIIILTLFWYFFKPFAQTEIFFLGLAWTLILITELQNTSFEEALDRLHPELHESIGRSKDMAAGAVLIAGFFMVFVMVSIVFF
jgi:diacylglycerol kinase